MINFAGAESVTDVAAGVLSFSHKGPGHEMAEDCLNEIKNDFRGYDWGYNGPGVITRVLQRICNIHNVSMCTYVYTCVYGYLYIYLYLRIPRYRYMYLYICIYLRIYGSVF